MLDRRTTRESSAEGFESKIKSLVKFQTATSRIPGEFHEKRIFVDRGTGSTTHAGVWTNSHTEQHPRAGQLTVAKINLDAVVVEGTSRKSLKLGPGHLENSAIPGSSGNSVIVAHRDTSFRHLDELREGDEIDLRRP
jgi:sortase (surface protein transpeptidase)